MENLRTLVRDYFVSAGFKILEDRSEHLIADKLSFGSERDTRLIWVAPSGKRPNDYEFKLQNSISSVRLNYPDAKAFVLASSREGFSRDLLHRLKLFRVKFLVTIWFFDAPFKAEEAPKTVSAIADLRSLAASQKRVHQPFSFDTGDKKVQQEKFSNDLFSQLRHELAKSENPTIRIIVGRAGIGKSFLFRTLFDRLYGDFLSAKKEQRTQPRPIPLLPEHLKATNVLRTEALIDNFLRTDVAVPIGGETFKWLVVNGFATWLLDGLDELYAGDPGFFEYLLDLITTPGSKAQVTIWCRDSVLTTSDAFSEFQDLCSGGDILKIYRLSEWERPYKRHFVWLKLKARLPKAEEQDPEDIHQLLTTLESNETLKSLSKLPFYCDLLVQHNQSGELQSFTDDVSLLNRIIDKMIHREVEKGLFDMNYFDTSGLDEWLEQIAVDYIEDQRYADIDSNQAIEYGQIVLRPDLDEQIRHHMITSLLQFPLFRSGEQTGRITFAHDLIAETLAARAYLKILRNQPGEIYNRFTRTDLEDPTLLRFIASRLDAETEKGLIEKVIIPRENQARGFAVALSLLFLARPERDLIKRIRVNLDDRNLVAVRFEGRDLSETSFQRSDLSHAIFIDCDLQNAHFEGAHLNRTKFENNNLQNARFGNLSRVRSVLIGRKFEDESHKIHAWLADATGVQEIRTESCPTALQIMRLFGKYITPLGKPRRDDLNRRGLLAGKRFSGSASVEECLEGAVRYGYLDKPDFRGRYRRMEGDKYAEMINLVKRNSISDGIGRLIAELCPRRGCIHQI